MASMAVESYVSKLSPRKGDIVVLSILDQHDLEALAQAESIKNQLCECAKAGMFAPEIPLVVMYGQDRLQAMAAKQLGFLCATETGLVVRTDAQDSINCLAALYMLKSGQVVAAPSTRP